MSKKAKQKKRRHERSQKRSMEYRKAAEIREKRRQKEVDDLLYNPQELIR